MDVCASTLLGFAGRDEKDNESYDRAVKAHISNLNKLLKEFAPVLHSNAAQLLDLLDPTTNSISYLAVIDQTLNSPNDPSSISHDLLLRHITLFLVKFDPRQTRYVGAALLNLLEKVASGTLLPPLVAVRVVCAALLRLDPAGSLLTSTHCLLVRYAYDADCTDDILGLIDRPITYYPTMLPMPPTDYLCDMDLAPPIYMSRNLTLDIRASHVLEYDMACGLIWCSKRHWRKAFDAFERIITYPAKENGVSQIMVEAYKKWLLVGLLSTGQIPTEPVYTGIGARKSYNVLARPYTALAEVFVTTNAAQLAADAAKSQQFWDNDGNTTLVREVLKAYQKWQVLNLREIYNKLSLSEIRQLTQSGETGTALQTDQEVEDLVADMVESGMLKGAVGRQEDGSPYVAFLPGELELSEVDLAQRLTKSARRIKALGATLKATNERLMTGKDYVKYLAKEQKRLESQGDKADPALVFDSQIEDEDLMTGLLSTV